MLQEVPQEIAELWRAFDDSIGKTELDGLLKVLNQALKINPQLGMEDLMEISLTMGVGTDNIPPDVLANYKDSRQTESQTAPVLAQLGISGSAPTVGGFSKLSKSMGR